jgi:hypothetical protein
MSAQLLQPTSKGTNVNYTILIYENAADFAVRNDPDQRKREAYWAVWPAYTQVLKDAGVFVGGAGLQPPETATVLRLGSNERHVQDGPYADTKEQLGGFYIIDVPDQQTALDWAARCPAGTQRVVEVRPNLAPMTASVQAKRAS